MELFKSKNCILLLIVSGSELAGIILNFTLVSGDFVETVLCPEEHAIILYGECIKCSHIEDIQKNISRLEKNNTRPGKRRLKTDRNSMKNLLLQKLTAVPFGSSAICVKSENDIEKYILQKEVSRLNGTTVKVVTIVRYPFVKFMNKTYTGIIYEFLYAVQRKYNFSMEVMLPYDGNWGNQLANGTWNGMIGMIIRKEADIGAAGFSVTLDRARVIDFTWAFHQEPSAILIPPPTEGEKLTVLIRPLSKQVWAAVLATIFLLIPSLYAFHRGSLAIQGQGNTGQPGLFSVFSELLWFLIGSILQQGLISPVDKSTRFLTVIWWFVTLVIANIYVAFLVSYLSAPQLHNAVDSLEALSRQSKLKWTFRGNTAHRSLFKSETATGYYKAIGDGAKESDLVLDDDTGVSKVLKNNFAFIKEKSFLDVAIGKDFEEVKKCRITLAKETFFTVGTALVVSKKSSLLRVLDYNIGNAIATGILEKWKKLHWPKNVWCVDAASYIISTRPKTRKLTLDDVQGAYFILGSGVTISLISFFLESFMVWINHLSYYLMVNYKLATTWKFVR